MSDYLTRLIERSLGTAPKIEPLIAPLHAPVQQILSAETGTIAPSTGDPANGMRSKAASSKTESQRVPGSDLPSGSPAGFSIDTRVGPSHPGESRQAFSPPAPGALDPASAPLLPPPLSQESTRVVVKPEIIERPKPAAATDEPLRSPEDQSRIVVQPAIIGRHKPPKSSDLPAPQTSGNEPPAIHVTIGRVEVRAVMSPSAPPKVASRAARKLSLEDYLKQRNGGGR